jgi:hypothetical protein
MRAKFQVTVVTDHKNLLKFTTTKELTRRHMRWSETLSGYNFRIVHQKGRDNVAADALSRSPAYKKQSAHKSYRLLKKDGSELLPTQYVGVIVVDYTTEQLEEAYELDKDSQTTRKKGNW